MPFACSRFAPALFAVSAVALLPSARLAAQGSLTPSGAPAPSMKSLADLEPRIPVQSLGGDATAQYVISQPGNYYLTGNITGVASKSAIAIDADGVTLDFRGHALVGVAGSFYGVDLRNNHSQIVLENGSIRSFPLTGVFAINGVTASRFSHLVIANCTAGINVVGSGNGNDGVVVRECTVTGTNTGAGIILSVSRGTVERCVVTALGGPGITGISARNVTGCEVTGLTASSGNATGISSAGLVSHCTIGNITASSTGNAIGISGIAAVGCEVADVQAGSGFAYGIVVNGAVNACNVANVRCASGTSLCHGISAGTVTGCRAESTASNGRGTPIGISAGVVVSSTVVGVGGSQGTVTPIGISAPTVSSCTVTNVGNGAAAAGSTGILGNAISDCGVSSMVGGTAGNSVGISGVSVQRCTVNAVSLAGGGSGTCTGILAEEIIGCRVNSVTSTATGNATGLSGHRLARDSSVATVTNPNAFAWGAQTSNAGRTENVVIAGATTAGIVVSSNHMVTGCSVSGGTNAIQATGVRNVIDGNNITGSSTNGISASSGTNTANALIIRNQIRNCTTNILADAPCQVGPIVLATGTIAGTNPWTNFTD